MARSGGRSQWERDMAAQRREAERQARERARLAKEREKARQERHIQAQQQTAERKTAEAEQQIKILDEILTSILPLAVPDFDSLKVTPELPSFDPGPFGTAEPAPDWANYAPPEPGGLSRLFGGVARHERQTSEARNRFDTAVAEHIRREGQRQQTLAVAGGGS
jgi:restriction system protein